ncbi:MAG: hypothetical protein ACKER6_00375, partial [Candidatus Hodgkinia cicadicola]
MGVGNLVVSQLVQVGSRSCGSLVCFTTSGATLRLGGGGAIEDPTPWKGKSWLDRFVNEYYTNEPWWAVLEEDSNEFVSHVPKGTTLTERPKWEAKSDWRWKRGAGVQIP